jgi:gliding motility associated protien GldN
VLYYPKEPEDGKMNLFTFLFKLVMRQEVKAYKYTMTGKEDFSAANVENREDILKRHNIAYEKKNDKFRILDIDIPSADVKSYFIKESTYFDQHTAQFRTQVTAICPVREDDEFGKMRYPMFWLKYEDIAPFLAKLELMASDYNNASVISADDYFATNQYVGKIYMTSNLRGQTIDVNDTASLNKAQKRIEKELTTLESHVWGTDSVAAKRMQAKTDSLSAVKEDTKTARASSRRSKKNDQSTSSRSQLKRQKSGESSGSAPKPRITVRRQRH